MDSGREEAMEQEIEEEEEDGKFNGSRNVVSAGESLVERERAGGVGHCRKKLSKGAG